MLLKSSYISLGLYYNELLKLYKLVKSTVITVVVECNLQAVIYNAWRFHQMVLAILSAVSV